MIYTLLFALTAFAHTTLLPNAFLQPRSQDANLTRPPCGGMPRLPNAPSFAPGAKITLDWSEVVNHPGRFEIYLSQANDQSFALLKTVSDVSDGTNDLPHMYTVELELPSVTCEQCTLQLVQVATENPNHPKSHYSCADFSIR